MKVKLLIAVGLLFALVAYPAALVSSAEDITINTTGGERITQRAGDGGMESYYLIYADEGTFTVKDSALFFEFDSSDKYGQLRKAGTYDVRVVGWRIPFFSSYQNIVEIY